MTIYDADSYEHVVISSVDKAANFAVVRQTDMPALLIEYGFISNLSDEKVIAFETEKQANLTFEGINSYLGVKPYNFH